jgi:hypothetical protein
LAIRKKLGEKDPILIPIEGTANPDFAKKQELINKKCM